MSEIISRTFLKFLINLKTFFYLKSWKTRKNLINFELFSVFCTDCKCKIEAQRLNNNKFCKRDYGKFFFISVIKSLWKIFEKELLKSAIF